MTREEFYNELERHDWTYSYSDDFRVYRSGEANIKRLKGIAAQSEELTELFDAYSAWYWNRLTGDKTLEKPTVES